MSESNNTGVCKYCGQSQLVRDNDLTEEECNAQVTAHCSCSEARAASKIAEQSEGAYTRIDQLFGNEAKQNGFKPIENESAIGIMKMAVNAIADSEIRSISIQITGNCKAKISVTAKGEIKVERTETIKRVLTE